jgi:hypothetical protein
MREESTGSAALRVAQNDAIGASLALDLLSISTCVKFLSGGEPQQIQDS